MIRTQLNTKVAALAALSLTALGCGGMITTLKGGPSQKDVDRAYERKDMAELDAICSGKKKAKQIPRRRACKKKNLLEEERAYADAQGDIDKLSKVCGSRKQGWREACREAQSLARANWDKERTDCDKVLPALRKWRSYFKGNEEDEMYFQASLKVAQCGNWDVYFEQLSHWGQGRNALGFRGIQRLHGAGLDMDKQLMAYLERHPSDPFAFEHGQFAVAHITKWLLETGRTDNCRRFVPYAKVAKPGPLDHWLAYFGRTKCVEAAPIAVARLESGLASRRVDACNVLAAVGSKRHLRKLAILSRTDPAYKIRGLSKIYVVRDACRAAMGRIQLRR